MNAWDCLAGFLLIEEAGGVVEPFNRGDVISNGTIALAGGPGVFEWIKDVCVRAFAPISPLAGEKAISTS